MTITYPLSLPTSINFDGVTLKPVAAVASQRSPFSLEASFQRLQGQMWQGTLSLPLMSRDTAEDWLSWLVALNGMEGTFLMGVAGCSTPRGAIGGTPLVAGAGQSGNTLQIDGCTPLVMNWLKAGDYIQLGSGLDTHLHKNLNNASTDSGGFVTLDLWPRLRASPADNDPVVVSGANGLWRLAGNEMPFSLAPGVLVSVDSIEVIEAI